MDVSIDVVLTEALQEVYLDTHAHKYTHTHAYRNTETQTLTLPHTRAHTLPHTHAHRHRHTFSKIWLISFLVGKTFLVIILLRNFDFN